MPNSIKCKIKHLYHNGTITKRERDRILKALEQEPCEDCISRQAAIEAMGEQPLNWTDTPEEIAEEMMWEDHVKALKKLPSVTALPNRWNKYDDNDPTTWPEDGSWGLWQHKSGKMNVLRWKQDALNHFYPDPYMWDIDDVVAWMPLPEPYKAERSGEDADSD